MPTRATDIAGYTYKTETLCRDCTMQAVSQDARVNLPCGITIETWLDVVAARLGINRYDEREYDSSDFPKVVFTHQLDNLDHFTHDCGYEHGCTGCLAETCDHCGGEL